MTKKHVIDGVTYEEVEKDIEIGDTIILVNSEECPDVNGKVGEVINFPFEDDDDFDVDIPSEEYVDHTYVDANTDEFHVLVPVASPMRHEIDGVLYEEVERNAEVGEKVVVVSNEMRHGLDIGEIVKVGSVSECRHRAANARGWFISDHNKCDYRVLVPVPSAAPESDADIIANLTRRVFELENARTSDGALLIEAFTEMLRKRDKEIGELRELVEMLTDDVVTLDERTQSMEPIEILSRAVAKAALS